MPPLSVPMNPICDAVVVAQMKRLSVDWKQPQGDPEGGQYTDSMTPSEHMCVPTPMCYFTAVSTNKYHVEQSDDVGKKFKEFAHNMLDGIKFAIDLWRLQAKFKDLKIMAVSAIGTPGCLKGPKLKSLIKSAPTVASMSGWGKNISKWINAVATGVSDCWGEWESKVTVPGLPWYPAFAAFPGPMAPPMPNVPTPLITCPSAGMAKMTPAALKSAMCDNYDLDDPDDQFGALAQGMAVALSTAFMAWLPSQQVMLVMGKGPIPTFAPPYVPVGPVLMGDNLPIPGHLAA
ncbi:MAG: hypothetical protein ACI9OJ_001401 [Myxococcota bacterium]|jgi:hypothetical protein